MPVRHVALLSLHTSPLAQPGTGDGGGMNVYVRSLASALARAGVGCDVYTRAESPGQPSTVVLEPGFRVLHLPAGPVAPVAKEALPDLIPEFTAAMLERIEHCGFTYDLLHANYWLSGEAAHTLKHMLALPLVTTFHTLARVKAAVGAGAGDADDRGTREEAIIRCCDLVVASTSEEVSQLAGFYGADPDRIEVVAPGVDHRVFSPGDRDAAKRALGVDGHRVLLFVGRIQPLKGADLAVRSLAALDDPGALLIVVGGPSGPDGPAEFDRLHTLARDLGVERQVRFVPPRAHDRLAVYYRAADVCLVPSRSESFGLVALEAAACGTPVVASSVGGLRGLMGELRRAPRRSHYYPLAFAAAAGLVLRDPVAAAAIGRAGAAHSMRYSWGMTAARLRRLYGDVASRSLVECP